MSLELDEILNSREKISQEDRKNSGEDLSKQIFGKVDEISENKKAEEKTEEEKAEGEKTEEKKAEEVKTEEEKIKGKKAEEVKTEEEKIKGKKAETEFFSEPSKKREKKPINKLLLIPVALGLVTVIAAMILAGTSGLVPGKYMVFMGIAAVVLTGAGLLCVKRGGKVLSVIAVLIGILMIVISVLLGYFVYKTDQALDKVSGASYKVDSMVVVVRKDDSATTVEEAKDYLYGTQMQVDKANTLKMVGNLKSALGVDPKIREFSDIIQEAQGLLSGITDASIYNEAMESLISDQIEGYEDQVRVLYRYEVKTELGKEDSEVQKKSEKNLSACFNVYVSGIDTEGDISSTSRSDVNLILSVNPNTHKVLITTTPRDYYVTFPGVTGDKRDKLTHAGIYGVDVSERTLEQIYDTKINYYVRLNFTGFKTIIDLLGGVDVYSPAAFTSRGYSFVEGINHMNGEQALVFVRERYSFQDGDNQRGKNQEALLSAVIEKALSPSILMNIGSILDQIQNIVQTDMTREEMNKMITDQIKSGKGWEVSSQAVTGTGDMQETYSMPGQLLYVMWPNDESVAAARKKIAAILSNEN